ncbi:MAG: hypothetical protein K2Q20_04115, partial [Phycisphaerales bacterium]|nr:hypothetical protein [Phycisphaerales bacterium]
MPALAADDAEPPTIRMEDLREGRGTLMARMAMTPRRAMCFVSDPTPEQMANIMQLYGGRNPAESMGQRVRFFTDTPVWVDNGLQGPSGLAQRANLNVSFPGDGIPWNGGNNVLNATLTARFGAANLDRGREFIRQGLVAWERWAGVSYAEVADDNFSFIQNTTRNTTARGDIRVGGRPQGTASGVLAYNNFPSLGSDMVINTDEFPATDTANSLASSTNNFRYLRNVVSHEHGHGLGFIHPTPCDNTKLMEPFINVNFDALQIDELRGGQRNYGDRFSGNSSAATARDFGDLASPLRSVVAPNLSTNGVANANGAGNGTGQDWFRFTLSSAQPVAITVTPTGGTYRNASQTSGCNPNAANSPLINPLSAGDLAVELRSSTGSSILFSSSAGAPGVAGAINAGTLAAGTYSIRVVDNGPNSTANQFVQLYDFSLRVGTAKSAPVAIAGMNKRCPANTNCFFMGDINSYTTDTVGATTTPAGITAYAWDLDGDGIFETGGAQPSRQYPSTGTYTVSLRVTDSNGLTATDSINVVVTGAQAVISSVLPAAATQGVTAALTINGTNFKGIVNASQFTVSGTGVSITGVPVVNTLGTQVTGLSLVIDPAAAPGTRSLSVTNSDGTGFTSGQATLATAFTINAATGACCAADGSCAVQTAAACSTASGAYAGNGVTCVAAGCVAVGTCCASGVCTLVTQSACTTGAWTAGGSCSPNPCPPPVGTCCDAAGVCTLVAQASCVGGVWTQGGSCSPNPCPQPVGTCCAADGACTSVTQAACTGVWTSGGSCDPNPCPQPVGTCCATDGTCTSVTQGACAGVWTSGGACTPNPCPQPVGTCCATDGACTSVTQAACTGGVWTLGGACTPNPCPQPTGACCAGATCSVL